MAEHPDKQLITATSNLTDDDCKSIQAIRQQNNIPFIVNEHGAHSKYQSYYFEIKVKKEDACAVAQIANKFKQENLLK